MTCPRCKSNIPENSTVCEVCNKKIKKKNLFSKKKKDMQNEKKQINSKLKEKLKILVPVAIAVVALIVIILIIVKTIGDNTGLNLSDELSEFIGDPLKVAINETDEYFADESKFESANFIFEYNYIIEDDDSVQIDGVKYPNWAIYIVTNENDEISQIKYVDFRALKKNSKGYKTDDEINLDKFVLGDKFRTVNKTIGIEPFSITYNSGTIVYDYRYYFDNDFDDEQGMTLSVTLDNDEGYIYSTSQRDIPNWIY